MKHGEKMLICTLAWLALCMAANAVTSESSGSPYVGIVERNVFGLKPPPPPPDPEASKPPPPKIFLQGITTFGGIKRALFKAQMPPKPGEPPKGEQSFILAEGQRDGDMEVVGIDANSPGSVKVSAFGTIITLDFEHNGIKTTTAAPPPSVAPRPGAGVPPLGAPGANPFTPAGGAQPFSPARTMRPTGAAGSPGAYGGTAAPTTYSAVPATPAYGSPAGAVTLPGFTSDTSQMQPSAQPQQPPMSAEAQAALMALQQLANKNKVFPPAPPPIMQLVDEGNNPGSATVPAGPSQVQMPRAPSLPPLRPQ